MKWYRAHDRFYKRGEFYGINEEIHLHVLPEEKAFTVNVFNLSDEKRTVRGEIDLKTLGLDPKMQYVSADGLGTVENGRCRVSSRTAALGHESGRVPCKGVGSPKSDSGLRLHVDFRRFARHAIFINQEHPAS